MVIEGEIRSLGVKCDAECTVHRKNGVNVLRTPKGIEAATKRTVK
jgi:hypothetical protein